MITDPRDKNSHFLHVIASILLFLPTHGIIENLFQRLFCFFVPKSLFCGAHVAHDWLTLTTSMATSNQKHREEVKVR